jgi:hypothetical protein
VQPSQIDVCWHRACLHHFQKQFAVGFNDYFWHQGHECLVFGCGLPAVLVGSLLGGYERFNGVLPGACGDAVVWAKQIRLGDLQIEDGLPKWFVLGVEQNFGFGFGFGAQVEQPGRLVCSNYIRATDLRAPLPSPTR